MGRPKVKPSRIFRHGNNDIEVHPIFEDDVLEKVEEIPGLFSVKVGVNTWYGYLTKKEAAAEQIQRDEQEIKRLKKRVSRLRLKHRLLDLDWENDDE